MNRRKRLAAIVAGMATAVATALSAGFLLSPNAGALEDVSAQAQALWTNPNTGAECRRLREQQESRTERPALPTRRPGVRCHRRSTSPC